MNPRTLTPTLNTIVVATVVALIAGFVPSGYQLPGPDGWGRELRRHLRRWEVDTWRAVSVVQDQGADLLVLGSADEGRHGRSSVGSTAGWLLHSSPVPWPSQRAGTGRRSAPVSAG